MVFSSLRQATEMVEINDHTKIKSVLPEKAKIRKGKLIIHNYIFHLGNNKLRSQNIEVFFHGSIFNISMKIIEDNGNVVITKGILLSQEEGYYEKHKDYFEK